jgi:hypothetical protein
MSASFSNLFMMVAMFVVISPKASEAGAPTNAAAGSSFESFKIVSDRNIFNQNRSSRTARRDDTRSKPAPVVHSLSLVGTMSFDKGTFAFFDGSRPEYKKPLKAGEKIAGYEIKEIKPNGVTIANETNQFALKVGQQLRREDDAEWHVASARDAVVTNAANSGSEAENPSSPSGASGSEDEALKRLMEKRAKELNQ